jgi:DNA-directed RNA polymerase specialized sigma24 family protein
MKYDLLSAAELLRLCVTASDADSWEELIRRFHSLITGMVSRCARRWSEPSQAVHEELVQDTYVKLFRERHRILERLAEMPEQAVPGFLKVFVANLVHDHFRCVHANKRTPPNGLLEFDDKGLEHACPAAAPKIEREILLAKVNELLETQVSGPTADRDRQIFWLHHRHGMTAREIALIPYLRLSEKGVESVLFRLTALAKQGLASTKENASAMRVRSSERVAK